MDLEDSFQVEHLYLAERKCRSCGKTKNLIDGFYRIRKNKYHFERINRDHKHIFMSC